MLPVQDKERSCENTALKRLLRLAGCGQASCAEGHQRLNVRSIRVGSRTANDTPNPATSAVQASPVNDARSTIDRDRLVSPAEIKTLNPEYLRRISAESLLSLYRTCKTQDSTIVTFLVCKLDKHGAALCTCNDRRITVEPGQASFIYVDA